MPDLENQDAKDAIKVIRASFLKVLYKINSYCISVNNLPFYWNIVDKLTFSICS
jgi:hypothetical protein